MNRARARTATEETVEKHRSRFLREPRALKDPCDRYARGMVRGRTLIILALCIG